MTTLHGKVRADAKKNQNGQPYWSSTSVAVKNTCNAGVDIHWVLIIKVYQWHQTALGSRYSRSTILHPLHSSPVWVMTLAWLNYWARTWITFVPSLWIFQRLRFCTGDGYHPEKITAALQTLYPQIMTKLRFQLAPKPTKAEKDALGKTGFVPVATRWGKRTFTLLGWNDVRVWSRTKKRTLPHATAKLNLCFIRLMLKRLAQA